MSERGRYLTDEELRHDGFGEGFGSIQQALPEPRLPLTRRNFTGSPDTHTFHGEITEGDKLAAEDMCFEGGIIFTAMPLNKNRLES